MKPSNLTKEQKIKKIKKYCQELRDISQTEAYEYGGGIVDDIVMTEVFWFVKKINRRVKELIHEDNMQEEEIKNLDILVRQILEDTFDGYGIE